MDKVRELITREPKQDLNITKSLLLRLKVRFGQLSVTLSNAGHARKCVVLHIFSGDANVLWSEGLIPAIKRRFKK